ncbi:MAG: DUF4982 domain-containing protein [Victivallales bacterium]|nr:DUF4982 domain-containing protein [Victivallales bacterium]
MDREDESMRRVFSLDRRWRFAVDNEAERVAASAKHQWKFRSVKAGQEDGFKSSGFDDSRWELVDLPHDYGVRTAFSAENIHMCGAKEEVNVWYRKNFLMDESLADRHFSLVFEGVSMKAEVYFNGSLAGIVPGGYTWMEFDVSPRMHFGKVPNYITVFVRGDSEQIWKYEGVGIYDHVRLLARNPMHLAYNGLWGHSAKSPSGRWLLFCEAELENSLYETLDGTLRFELFDRDGHFVQCVEQEFQMEPDSRKNIKAPPLEMKKARPWDLEDPYLYRVRCSLLRHGKVIDQDEAPAGLRTAEFDPQQGFLLNGRKVLLKGFSNHFEHAGVGFAVPASISEYRVRRMLDMGANAYRCAHNQCLESVLDACDRLGMLVMDENRFFETREENLAMLRNQVRRNRKHPSVILYGLFSEEPLQCTPEGGRLYRKLKSVVGKLDGTRPFSGSTQRVETCCEQESVIQPMDVVGVNYEVWNWDRVHACFPDKAVLATEMTCMQTMRGELHYDPEKQKFDDYAQENHWFGSTAYETWKNVLAHPYLAGVFNHSAFDHRGEPQPLDYPLISCSYGAMDTCGFPKTLFYIFQSWFDDRPMMHVFPHWNHRPGTEVPVLTVTNCEECELFLNGRTLGVRKCQPCVPCLWTVAFVPGILRAVGYCAGEQRAAYEVKTAGSPFRLLAEPHKDQIADDGDDAVAINVQVVDQAGTLCPDAGELVTFHVAGGRILGVGNGNPASHEPDFACSRKLYHGRCQAIVACLPETSRLAVKATSPGLLPAMAELTVRHVSPVLQLPGSDSRMVDAWKMSCTAFASKPDPNRQIDWSENNAFVSVNMSSERFQDGLQPGWMLYRADIAIPNSSGKECNAVFRPGLLRCHACEIWVNGEKRFEKETERDEYLGKAAVEFPTGGADVLQVTILLNTFGGRAGVNGRDSEISIQVH